MANFPYFPHTDQDIRVMLDKIGVESMEDLFKDVPSKFLHEGEFDLPKAMAEQEVAEYMEELDAKNKKLKVFAGAGAYDHYTPSVVKYLTSRSEFLTAYTPYQAEISQGTLRYIFEYQSFICELTGMDISNASMYDGPTAAAEAVKMAVACAKKKNKVLISKSLLPQVIEVVETYSRFHGIDLGYIPVKDGQTCLDCLKKELEAGDVAGVLVPSINRYGIIEDFTGVADATHAVKAVVIGYCDPSALAVVKTPGEWGFDIAVGDGQPLGIPLSYGGPYVGFMACRKDYVRKMPGRIVGQTTDSEGKRCFVLTLQAREQHIRREKATSNICSNESLMALHITIYLALMGPEGLRKVNELSWQGAHYLYAKLLETGKFEKVYDKPFLKEFVLRPLVPADKLREKLIEGGFFGALDAGDGLVSFCVTERRSKEEIEELVELIKGM